MENVYNLNISTNDEDKFYVNGLIAILSRHFLISQGIDLRIRTININFIATSKSDSCRNLLPFITNEAKCIYFFIIENGVRALNKGKVCDENFNIIYRTESVDSVVKKINTAIIDFLSRDSYNQQKKYTSSCESCSSVRLTHSEYQVLNFIQKENTITEISYILNKSAKTIHGQKKNAMKKLGVASNHALYELLRKKISTPYLISQTK